MGWMTDDGLHEGYAVPEFADGVRGTGTIGGGVPDDQIIVAMDYDDPSGRYVTRPAAETIGWRVLCDCRNDHGDLLPAERRWSSELLVRVPSPALQDLEAGRIWATDDDVIFVPHEGDTEEAMFSRWRREHVDAHDALARISAARNRIRAAERDLDEAVAQARASRLSWEAIGTAAGMARQSAHSRWGHLSDPAGTLVNEPHAMGGTR